MRILPLIPLTLILPPLAAQTDDVRAAWDDEVLPIMEFFCHDCHGDGVDKGELDLQEYESIADMQADRPLWERLRNHVANRLMPPVDKIQPTSEEREKIVEWIDAAVFPVDPDNPDPGRVTLRRLNRVEYENTLRDLLGVRVRVQDMLPPDDSGYGFDNIGDVLTLSPAHLQRFLDSADHALDQAIHPEPMPYPRKTLQGEDFEGGGRHDERGRFFFTNDSARAGVTLDEPGRYRLTVLAGGSRAGEENPKVKVTLGEDDIATWSAEPPLDKETRHSREIRIDEPGEQRVTIAFTNDYYDPDHPDPNTRDRNLLVHEVRLEGPLDAPRPPKPESHRAIYGDRDRFDSDEAWGADIFRRFARRAFRRPPREGEAERYLHFIRLAREQERTVEEGIRDGLQAMLVSPAFLFREEPQPEPDNPDRIHQVNEHVLASRLSYFLWSTMPDERLMDLAEGGELRDRLDAEINRMLDSPKAREFVANFGGQWLQLRDLNTARPSRRAFPDFDLRLRRHMENETHLLIEHMIEEDKPVTDLLDADYTFVNGPLARHYGIEGVEGSEFEKVSLEGTPRRGLLGHGSFLLVTSHPLRTSPVLRGKYVLQNLLGTSPPPPPPNVPQLDSPESHGEDLSLREQMVRHREDPACASCHNLMDPIGFGLQNFDADGSWRTEENGEPIDASGKLVSGREFAGAGELREILLSDHRDEFLRSVASKMLTYALGRGTEWYDQPAIDGIVRDTREADLGTRALIRAVIHSVPFQYRRGER